MKPKKTIAISMATAALVLGKNVNDAAAMCALQDMASEFSTPFISMAEKPMPEDIYAHLHEEVHTTATKRMK